MLETRLTGIGDVVERRVVVGHVANEGEIKSLVTSLFENGEIGVVREALVNGVVDGVRGGTRSPGGKKPDSPAVGATGLEHKAGSRSAAGVKVHRGPDSAGERMGVNEGARAEKTGLFAIVDQENHGMLQRRQTLQRASNLQNRRNSDGIIGDSGPGGNGVVMGREQNGRIIRGWCAESLTSLARRLNGRSQAGHDVVYGGAGAVTAAGKGCLHLGIITEHLEFVDDMVADGGIGGAAGGVWNIVAEYAPENVKSSQSGKFGCRSIGRLGPGRPGSLEGKEKDNSENGDAQRSLPNSAGCRLHQSSVQSFVGPC